MKKDKEKSKEEQYVTKNDLEKVLDAITEIAHSVNKLQSERIIPNSTNPTIGESGIKGTADLSNIKQPEIKITEEDEAASTNFVKTPIPPMWRKIVDEVLGMDFGIDVVYPQSGSGFLFKLIIPSEKSNASQSYKEFYKVDIRTKALSYSDGIDGIRKFCELVAINLRKNNN